IPPESPEYIEGQQFITNLCTNSKIPRSAVELIYSNLAKRHCQIRIKSIELQGHGIGWQTPIVKPLLPTPQRDSPNAADNCEMMCYYSALSSWINKAFLPQSVSVAKKAVKYLLEDGCDLLKQNLAFEKNQFIASRTISLNTQITTHRDKKNAL
ncbi:hypothetical protein PSHT_06060, partial [Puccinia striiformis]